MALNGVHYEIPLITETANQTNATSQLIHDNHQRSIACINQHRADFEGQAAGAYEDALNMVNTKYAQLAQTVGDASNVLNLSANKMGEGDGQAAGQYGR
ncbi:WXG100 family type VII secretion target [Mycobacteroides chelonae]|jgi:uncharacterized protein YukE|uniref:WXG100 family type VII secretion target n=1 Tax=Mycobacteroides chelonae TaxID=1774 RepID=UPI0009920A9B|nr:WXG100 family type VII secretion target [Mycobacteroides chelonae]